MNLTHFSCRVSFFASAFIFLCWGADASHADDKLETLKYIMLKSLRAEVKSQQSAYPNIEMKVGVRLSQCVRLYTFFISKKDDPQASFSDQQIEHLKLAKETYLFVSASLIGNLTPATQAAIDEVYRQDDTLFSPERKKDLFDRLRQCRDFGVDPHNAVVELSLE